MPARIVFALALVLCAAGVCLAGPRVHIDLVNGSVVEGELVSFEDGSYRVDLGSQVLTIPEADVAEIVFVKSPAQPAASPRPTAAPVPEAAPSPSPRPSARPEPRPSPANQHPQPTPAVSQPGFALNRAFSYEAQLGDVYRVKRWERTVHQNGETLREELSEAVYLEGVEEIDEDGVILQRLRHYIEFKGRGELDAQVKGLRLTIQRQAPGLYTFESANERPVPEELQLLLIQEFEQEQGLSQREYLPAHPVEVGDSWELSLADTGMVSQFTNMGLELDPEQSSAHGTLLTRDQGKLGIAVTFNVKPSALNGIPFDPGALMVASTTIWVPEDGSGPVARQEDTGAFSCQIQGTPVRMEVTKVVEVELER